MLGRIMGFIIFTIFLVNLKQYKSDWGPFRTCNRPGNGYSLEICDQNSLERTGLGCCYAKKSDGSEDCIYVGGLAQGWFNRNEYNNFTNFGISNSTMFNRTEEQVVEYEKNLATEYGSMPEAVVRCMKDSLLKFKTTCFMIFMIFMIFM
jgi:hypothetical protein